VLLGFTQPCPRISTSNPRSLSFSARSIYLPNPSEPNEPKVRSYSAEHQRVRTSTVQVPPQEDVGMPE
jgi:hypothetical protein